MLITSSLILIAGASQAYAATGTSSGYAPQFSPNFPNVKPATGVVTSYNPGPYDTSATLSTAGMKGYPETWKTPSTSSAEVKAAYNSIDWSKVPKAPQRKQKSDGSWTSSSDPQDKWCWWSSTNCVKPKVSYLPADIYSCPKKGDWGLTYDDGPFNKRPSDDSDAKKENPYAEPVLYNFLTKTNQKATLFYIGSNVATYPAAAKRGLNDGHHLCSHTWSHPVMTTLSNAEIVAELYWSLKAIKEATGVTTQCWRPPQGDVDDRVRAIAWQMGMHTVLWDLDTNDWDMPAPGGGSLPPATVDGYFQSWIDNEKAGNYKTGHIVLEHELNSATVKMSMKWMPKIQSVFNVVPALACNGVSQPYWEKNFVYPIDNSPPSTKTTTSTGPTNTPSTCAAGSAGLGNGDGYNGACCDDQSDCVDDCISGICNGPANPNQTTTTNVTKTTISTGPTNTPSTCAPGSSGLGNGDGYNGACCEDQSDCVDDCISGACNGPVNPDQTTTKVTKTTTSKATSTANCIAGSRGKKKGNGKDGYCCSSSADCLETCRSGKCGL